MLSPVVEREINEYYKARNGTPAGVPVVVVGVNTDQTSQSNTDNFIRSVGFDLVLDDPTWKSYAQFGPGNSASRYVIINGLADSSSHKQWEVLFNQVYFQPRQPEIVRAVIESVKPAAPTPPKIIVQPQSQTVTAGAMVTFSASADGTTPISYQWHKGGVPIAGATSPTLALSKVSLSDAGEYSVVVRNAAGSEASQVINLKVLEPVRAMLSGLRRLENGGAEFVLTGEPGRNYHIEFSSDLISWRRLAQLTATDAKVVYRDNDSTAGPQGFYRAVTE
ncbi:MAG: immunoglobulin domain-containing protein [Verrucomicrobia bacterium]|nr:immunoglobulin domain-containing protein [Verrucomicrobiota bacterium]